MLHIRRRGMNRFRLKRYNYFTIIEILVALTIIAIIGAIALPFYYNYVKKARVIAATEQIRVFETVIGDYQLDTAKLPTSLDALIKNPGLKSWDGPYLKLIPNDPWGNNYIYNVPGKRGDFDLISYGSDGQKGGNKDASDISNWPEVN
jgi:general secretion pathway protein G